MKAIVCKSFGPPESLVLEDVPSRPLGKNEVRIAVKKLRYGMEIARELRRSHATARIGNLGQNFSRVLEQTFAGLGHHDRARQAIEQPFTHLGFQLLNLLTERRLSDMFASSRARETAFVNDSNEVTELMNLHRRKSSVARVRSRPRFVYAVGKK